MVAFGSTIVGGAVAGVVSATLSAPFLAMLIKISGQVKDYEANEVG